MSIRQSAKFCLKFWITHIERRTWIENNNVWYWYLNIVRINYLFWNEFLNQLSFAHCAFCQLSWEMKLMLFIIVSIKIVAFPRKVDTYFCSNKKSATFSMGRSGKVPFWMYFTIEWSERFVLFIHFFLQI